MANLPDSQEIIVLINSGAPHSLISDSYVSNFTYLSKLHKKTVKQIKFKVGNGEYISTDSAVVSGSIARNVSPVRACSGDDTWTPWSEDHLYSAMCIISTMVPTAR